MAIGQRAYIIARMLRQISSVAASLLLISHAAASARKKTLRLPKPGDYEFNILAPDVLELTLITTKEPDPARPKWFDFANDKGKATSAGGARVRGYLWRTGSRKVGWVQTARVMRR